MQNTVANRRQTRINGGCEVEFIPHHRELVCIRVLGEDAGFYKSQPGPRHWTYHRGSLSKPGLASLVPAGEKPEVNQFCRLWAWSDVTPHPRFPRQLVPSSGSADHGCSLRVPDIAEGSEPTRFPWPLQQAFLGFRRENGPAEISKRPVVEAKPTADLRPP